MAGGVNWIYTPWNCALDTCPQRQVIGPHPTAPAQRSARPSLRQGWAGPLSCTQGRRAC